MQMFSLSLNSPLSLQKTRREKLLPESSDLPAMRHISSQSLLDGARELVIQHEGSDYYLRLTRNDKLILTK